jgi:hypothetical protein
MKNEDEFLKDMENLKVPDVDVSAHQKAVKIAIMNAERSAVLGVWLIIIPCYFLFCVCMYYYFHVRTNFFEATFTLVSDLDKSSKTKFLSPLLLVGLPIVSIVVNALAITHVTLPRVGPNTKMIKEFSLTVKVKLWNILLIIISLLIVSIFLAYAIVENITIKN